MLDILVIFNIISAFYPVHCTQRRTIMVAVIKGVPYHEFKEKCYRALQESSRYQVANDAGKEFCRDRLDKKVHSFFDSTLNSADRQAQDDFIQSAVEEILQSL